MVTIAPPAVGNPPLHILYLDDDESLVLIMQRLLRRRGFQMSGYTQQAEALAAIRAAPHSFNLVVTDYTMPGMSGLEVAAAVRDIRPNLPIAIASGFIDEHLQTQATAAGIAALLYKTNAAEDFGAAIERLAQGYTTVK